jgi:hypothetical protein
MKSPICPISTFHQRLPGAIAIALLSIGCGLSCGNVTDPEANAVGGVYILTQVDGVTLPDPPPAPGSPVPCPPAITDGEMDLTPVGERNFQQYVILANQTRACDPDGIPVDATSVLHDGGDWSISGNKISFSSSPSNRQGNYTGTVTSTSPVPVVTVSLGGHAYTYRRLADQERPSADVTVLVIDPQGHPVGLALVVFRSASGLVTRSFTDTGTTRPRFRVLSSPGIEVISIGPPAGYTFAPGQQNPVMLTIGTNEIDTVKVVLTKVAP